MNELEKMEKGCGKELDKVFKDNNGWITPEIKPAKRKQLKKRFFLYGIEFKWYWYFSKKKMRKILNKKNIFGVNK